MVRLRDLFEVEEPWEPVSRGSVVAWVIFYGAFLAYGLSRPNGFWVLDPVNLIVHEGGHALFSWFGETATLYGGTLLQFLVPLALAFYFWLQRRTTAVAFTVFWTCENFCYTGTYMADARAQALPLVTVGEPEAGAHDWAAIFARWGLLRHDVAIGRTLRVLGVLGMLATVAWLVHRHRHTSQELRRGTPE